MLVDVGGGEEGEERGHAERVVGVVVREEDGADGEVLRGEECGECAGPLGEALACVEEEARGAAADEVGVCSYGERVNWVEVWWDSGGYLGG